MRDAEMNIGAMLAEQLDRLLARTVDTASLVAVESGADVAGLWREIEDLGICHAMSGGELGADLSWEECLPLMQVLGWHGAPVPLGETLLAVAALSDAGCAVAEGRLTLSTARYTATGDGHINGSDDLVPWLGSAEAMVGIAEQDGVSHVFSVEVAQLDWQPVDTIARIPSGQIKLDDVSATTLGSAKGATNNLQPQLALLRAAQISGLLNRVLQLVIEYANTRTQFGRPIGKFQAIQHQVADLATHAAAAQAATAYGCRQLDEGRAEQGAAIAKARASAAAGHGARIAHQVFGAIGVTEEHELHHLTRRLWQWRQECGSEHEWNERLGRLVIAAGGNNLWPKLVGDMADEESQYNF